MEKLYIILLVFLTVNLVKSTEIICEDLSTAESCQLRLNVNITRCETDENFRRICPCTCDEHRTRNNPTTPVVENPDENPDSDSDCEADIANDCELRFRADPSICDIENIMEFCPCTCRERLENPEVHEQEDSESVDHHDDDEIQNVVNPTRCADVPDSKMEYDCQFRIAQNSKLCNDPSYRGMCRCTCIRFGNRFALEENAVDSLLTPDDVLPIVPEEDIDTEDDPERCPDYRDSDRGRSCFMRVANLRREVCPDDYREACPCTCRALDEGELCPDSPWTPLSGVCQMRANNGECSDLKVREDCPCTCAFVSVGPAPVVETNPEDEDTQIDQSHIGCIDTASERSCHYYVTHDMCASQYQYCRLSCNMCSSEPIPDGEEPVVNLMPDVDAPEEVENSEDICEDNAPSEVCNNYKETGLCGTRWVFCKKTCDACEINTEEEIVSVETESESEIELEEEKETDDDGDDEYDDLPALPGLDIDEEDEEEADEEQPCVDSISTSLCENYVQINQCVNWWRYCRQTCGVCEENPYLEAPEMPVEVPDGSTSNLNGLDQCPQCELYESNDNCNSVDQVVKDYCQTHCELCLSEEEIILEEEQEEEEEEEEEETEEQIDNGEDEAAPIDDEEILNEEGLLPEPCRSASDDHVNCQEWYRADQCAINPTVREVCSWSCNECAQLIQLIDQDQTVNNEESEDEVEHQEEQEEEEIELELEEEEEEEEQQQEQEEEQEEQEETIELGNDEGPEEEEEGDQPQQPQQPEEEQQEEETIELDNDESPVVAQECVDVAPWCPDYEHLCEDEQNYENMRENCEKTCGHC